MNNYKCSICGYIYEPKSHHDKSFESLVADWTCPICGAVKSDFKILKV